MSALVLIIHILLAVSIVGLVLVQHGKGADAGAAFGSGASNTMFGSAGSKSFLFKLTMGFATLFFATSIFLSYQVHAKTRATLNLPVTGMVTAASKKMTLTIKPQTSADKSGKHK